MSIRLRSCLRLIPLLCALALVAAGAQAQSTNPGQPYRLGVGDVLQLSVWQQPDLDRELTVRDDGTIVVPLVGEVRAVGSTVPELEELLARRLRSFNRDITEVSITVTSYRSLQVFVMGAVARPGVQSFEEQPTVWDAIRTAGGPLASANLRRVRVLHQSETGTSTRVVNVARVVSGETGTEDLPRLEPGDTVIVPDDQVLTAADRESGVQVLGEVAAPGFYPVESATPLMTVILQAGGFTEGADLRMVRVVHDTGRGVTESREVNVRHFLEQAQVSGNPLLYAGDTVYVEARPVAQSFLRTVPGIITSVAGLVAIILSVSNNN